MRFIERALQTTLDEFGLNTGPLLGPAKAPIPARIRQRLVENMEAQAVANRRYFRLVFALYMTCFTVALGSMLLQLSDSFYLRAVQGLSFGGLLVLLRQLRNLWAEKTAFGILLAVVPALTPSEAAQAALTVYCDIQLQRRSNRRRTSLRSAAIGTSGND